MSTSFSVLPTKRYEKKKHTSNTKPVEIPAAVLHQRALKARNVYCHRCGTNGNIENNSTLYVNTALAHPHQLKQLFDDVVERAKRMPEIFGDDFTCDVQINLVRKHTGEYIGYSFVDVDNPLLYYALIGCNLDGTDRVQFVPDPTWVPPKIKPVSESWADDDTPIIVSPPMIRKELPPILSLGKYTYDEQQLEHVRTQLRKDDTEGRVTVSPAFITPGVKEDHDDTTLYVSEVPAPDDNFLYSIFSRYVRYTSPDEDERIFYPKITIRKNDDKFFAIVKFNHPYDIKFALHMLKTIRANYNGVDVNMRVRSAFKEKR